jgi:hypothetical protein
LVRVRVRVRVIRSMHTYQLVLVRVRVIRSMHTYQLVLVGGNSDEHGFWKDECFVMFFDLTKT